MLIAAFIIGATLLVGGCEQRTDEPVPPAKEQFIGKIVAIGDSLTAGLGLEESAAYPAQLQRKLLEDGKKYQVINAGVSGETTSGTLSRLNWILSQKPDIVILAIGANDGLRGLEVSIAKENITAMLDQLQENGVITVLAGMKMVWNLGPQYTTEFNDIYPALAGKHELIFMPFLLEGVAMVPELNLEDGIHPNKKGYSVIVENIYPFVVEAIEKLKSWSIESEVKPES